MSVVPVQIRRGDLALIPSFRECLDRVAREQIYIEMIEAPALDVVMDFQVPALKLGVPIFYAIHEAEVIGWCDIFPETNPRQKHRGNLGMGLDKDFRGQGLGQRLLEKTLHQAKVYGLEKVELTVYTSNLNAIALYEKNGFVREGLIQKYRKLNERYFDCLQMGKFLE